MVIENFPVDALYTVRLGFPSVTLIGLEAETRRPVWKVRK